MTTPTRKDLATMLAALPYGIMMQVAKELVEMNQDPEFDRNPRSINGMAETLSDWGNAQQDD